MWNDLQCFYVGSTNDGSVTQQSDASKFLSFPFLSSLSVFVHCVVEVTDASVQLCCCRLAEEEEQLEPNGDMEPSEGVGGRSFVEVMSEKYSPENFPYRRGPGMGVVVVVPTVGPQGSPMKGELTHTWLH